MYYGEGRGKSTCAIGRALVCASEGREVFVIQFLKGRMTGKLDYYKNLEPDIKVFRFEREKGYYENLPEQSRKEEAINIRNGVNFARKVLRIGECDVLVLDEILGLADLGIISCQDIIDIIRSNNSHAELILTGRNLPPELADYADYICRFDVVKDTEADMED